MRRLRILFVLLLIVSCTISVLYIRPPNRIEVAPTETTDLIYIANTRILDIRMEGSFAYSIEITTETSDSNITIIDIQNRTTDITLQLPRAGIFHIKINSDSIGVLFLKNKGVPSSYVIYIIGLVVVNLYLNRFKFLDMI